MSLVISHRKRVQVNAVTNRAMRPGDAVFIRVKPCKADLSEAQDFWLWPGMKVLGCLRAPRKGIKHNCEYEVTAVTEDIVTLDDEIHLTHEELAKLTRLAHARTYASVQGLTFEKSCRLFDTDHPRFTKTHLFVAVSRCREMAQLHVI